MNDLIVLVFWLFLRNTFNTILVGMTYYVNSPMGLYLVKSGICLLVLA